jgi:hypothetical protein
LGFYGSVDPGFRVLFSMSADEFQGFNDRCEQKGKEEEIGVGLEVGEGACKLRPGSA